MVGGAFSATGTGELLRFEKVFSKEEQSDVIFQQDNAPAHTAITSKTWLENKSIRLMFWSRFGPEYLASH